jgi:hypothetical protein
MTPAERKAEMDLMMEEIIRRSKADGESAGPFL